MLAQVAIPLAIALGDDAMLARYLDESLLVDDARNGPFTATQTRVAAAHAMGLAATNRVGEGPRAARTRGRVADHSLRHGAADRGDRDASSRARGETCAHCSKPLRGLKAIASIKHCSPSWTLALRSRARLDAAQRFAAIGWPLLEARALEMAGEPRRAIAIYKRCGAAGELRRLEFGESASAQAAPLGALTPRERELALQVASGKANRAVADALSIGEKTVEKYLTSIYTKLGLTSRAQLAALVRCLAAPTRLSVKV